MIKTLCLCLSLFVLTLSPALAATYYVAPNGSDTQTGTINSPFATIGKAQEVVNPGDTVYLRGGNYSVTEAQIVRKQGIFAYVNYLDKSGTANARINYWAYPGEKPVFDFSKVKPNLRVIAFYVAGSYIHFKGLEITGVQVTLLNHTQSECFENHGSNNIYELLSMHDGQAIGIYLLSGSNNLFLNCDAFRNYDSTSEGGRGGNTDGFGCHGSKGSVNNIFRGCRAWFNSDDGYDCINSAESVVFENCWSFYNGFSPEFKSLGDGNGFKAGGYGATAVDRLPSPIPRNTIRFCLAVRNKANGFYSNHHISGSDWYNNSAFGNGVNYNMLNRLKDNKTDVPGYGHRMKNNLGYRGRAELSNLNAAESEASGNSFNQIEVSDKDFVGLDEADLTRSRQPNGDLPEISSFHLAPGSKLIDRGADVGLPFSGAAPDLGAFEFGAAKRADAAGPASR